MLSRPKHQRALRYARYLVGGCLAGRSILGRQRAKGNGALLFLEARIVCRDTLPVEKLIVEQFLQEA